MTQQQAIKAVKAAKEVYVGVKLTSEDITYFRVTKSEALHQVMSGPFSDENQDYLITHGQPGDGYQDCVFIN
jgi:hypothetical protein